MGGVCSSGASLIKDTEDAGNVSGFAAAKPDRINNGFTYQKHILSSPKNQHDKSPRGKGASIKIGDKGSILGKTATLNIKTAVQALDNLGKSVPNLNAAIKESRGNQISVMAFEVANTIAKGANLIESLSDKNIKFLKEILHSEAVQQLVSTDMDLLLIIAAADKREEFDVILKEVIRFGNRCKDTHRHNLGRYFSGSDLSSLSLKISKEETEATMRELTSLAQHTSQLYHELNVLDRFEHEYKQKLEEAKAFNLPQRGEDLELLHDEVKLQRKLVKGLKKKSLWSKNMHEIMVKFVEILPYVNQKFEEAFGSNGKSENSDSSQRLGASGLALHYANLIVQIDTIASRPTCLPPNVRDSLFHALPQTVKTALRSRLRTNSGTGFTISRVKAEMDKTSKWLVPAATNTLKIYQKFGRVGDWASSSKEQKKNSFTINEPVRLQTLYHADKVKTELYILEQVTQLHYLIFLAKQRVNAIVPLPPVRCSVNRKSKLSAGTLVQKFPPISYTSQKSPNIFQEDRGDLLAQSAEGSPNKDIISRTTCFGESDVTDIGLSEHSSELT